MYDQSHSYVTCWAVLAITSTSITFPLTLSITTGYRPKCTFVGALSRIRPYLTRTLVLSELIYCNSFLSGLPSTQVFRQFRMLLLES